MCGGGGGPSQEDQDAANAQSQDNFNESQGLAAAQFEYQKSQADEARRLEEEKRSRIRSSVSSINSAFKAREPIFKELENSTFDLNKNALDDQRTYAQRETKFSLARSGLAGGSVDVDKSADLTSKYNSGLQTARTSAISAANSARANDANIQNNLIATAGSGAFSGQELLNGASGALSAIENSPASVAPQFDGNAYFSDVLNSLGGISYDLARGNRFQGGGNTNSSGGLAINTNGNYNGSIRGIS